ncbi:complex I assembly factor TIMMDC1, mitochondrial isoform X1 [Brachionichthys hirsutus]|uniref:complex I assembly factor TIMMDC1, mitochondrial isoform X1 n=1 Tax=Brachionichthys hirsutus TaxID=412623 RepID=UPI003604C077
MRPEQPRTGLALQRRWADSGPGGSLSTGRLRGLIQSARTASFCFLLPRVHAAAITAAPAAQMPPSPSSSPALARTPSPSTVPGFIGKPEYPETGWDRVKDLFAKEFVLKFILDLSSGAVVFKVKVSFVQEMQTDHIWGAISHLSRANNVSLPPCSVTQWYSDELTDVIKSGLFAGAVGFLYGGLPAARSARQRYIQASQAELYTSRVEAVRSAHNASIRGFLRYGWRWSWRVAALVVVFNSVNTGLSAYRDKSSLSHYAAAGAVAGGLFRLTLGLRGFVAGAIIGTALGIPSGALIIGMQALTGEDVRARRKRERREIYERRLAEWSARLQLTDQLIGDLNVGSEHERTNQDARRIHELLSLPRSDEDAGDSSSQWR